MKIGLFFGSFNPIHIGHLIIANQVANSGKVDQIWFVISPQNPEKQTKLLLPECDRLQLVKLAIGSNPLFITSDVEFGFSRPSFTINTLNFLQKKFQDLSFSLIMGSDNFNQITHWKEGPFIRSNYSFFVYERIGFPIDMAADVTIITSPLLNISSTEIRLMIKNKKSIQYLVPDKVSEEIILKKYYLD